MNKKITVEILRTTAGIGKQGEIMDVSLTYAENKLLPEGIAKIYTPQASKEEKKAVITNRRFDITSRLHEKHLTHHAKHEKWHLDETIDADWIVKKIRDTYHVTLLPEMIRADEKHIKKAGTYRIYIDITHDAYAQMILEIH